MTGEEHTGSAVATTVEKKGPKIFVLAKSRHYGHELSFEKYSNCGWHNQLHFSNGGLSVNLLKLDMARKSEVKKTLSAYKSIGALADAHRIRLD